MWRAASLRSLWKQRLSGSRSTVNSESRKTNARFLFRGGGEELGGGVGERDFLARRAQKYGGTLGPRRVRLGGKNVVESLPRGFPG